jgi:DNA-binding transcriptional regulator YiaG
MNDTQKPAPTAPSAARKPRTEPAPGTFAARVRETVARLNLDEPRAAAYFGVPVFTLRKWTTGEREPGAAVIRLLDVLGTLEALAPALHDSFLPPVAQASPRTRGRVKKLTSETRHAEKSGSTGSTDSTHDSVMSENPV